jgi:hypothetical protein
MEESDLKFFCCPECGARYKIILDGKRYKCKKCGAPFQTQNLFNIIIDQKPVNKSNDNKKFIKFFFFCIGCFLLTTFIIRINATRKISSSPTISTPSAYSPTITQKHRPSPIIPESNVNPIDDYKLELLSWRWGEEYGYFKVTGEVKNISSEPLKNVEILASFYDSNGNFIKNSEAIIEFNPIIPGQTSPFKAITSSNPAAKKATIQFKFLFGSSISYRDQNKK